MSNTLISIDPGKSTGVAIRFNGSLKTHIISGEDNSVLDTIDLFLPGEVYVICEAFYGGGITNKWSTMTIELIGKIKALCYLKGIPITMQPPQMRIAFIPEAKKVTKKEHEVDALAHLLAWEYKRK